MSLVEVEFEKVELAEVSIISYSVQEFIDQCPKDLYKNGVDYRFIELVEDTPAILKKVTNDMLAKVILSHGYGIQLAKVFRDWIRSQMDESIQLPCGGASIVESEEAYA